MPTGLFLGKPRRGMLRRAVFSDYQRKGLEKRFQVQKYISKPDRKKLAEKLGLKDSQVSKPTDFIGNSCSIFIHGNVICKCHNCETFSLLKDKRVRVKQE